MSECWYVSFFAGLTPRLVHIRILNVLYVGYGSNLTLSGTTECDASVMDGHTGDFGAVGSVSG